MNIYRLTIKPLSAFDTPLMGDTLFGQLCWAIAYRFGDEYLDQLLQGYTEQQPFMVVSNAFPHGYIPLPTLPSAFWAEWKDQRIDRELERKKLKKLAYFPVKDYAEKVNCWQEIAYHHQPKHEDFYQQEYLQFHNTINRTTQTTGLGQFAPFTSLQFAYSETTLLDLYIVLDEERFSTAQLLQVLQDIGQFGFGRDASTGMGKFEVIAEKETILQEISFKNKKANAYLTLANAAPQRLDLDKNQSFYQVTTRFGRHGGSLALATNPFKKPIILAKAGAVFRPLNWQERLFLGNGLKQVSFSQSQAVHQGYAPVIPVKLDFM